MTNFCEFRICQDVPVIHSFFNETKNISRIMPSDQKVFEHKHDKNLSKKSKNDLNDQIHSFEMVK